jgi:hypothetical protein
MSEVNASKELRAFGIIWIVLAPVLWLMAAISKVKSDVTYQVQLALFTVAAIAALIYGIAAVLRRPWARIGLLVLSCLAVLLFLGPGLVMLGYAVFNGQWEVAAIGVGTGLFGLPFLAMAYRLYRQRSQVGNDA